MLALLEKKPQLKEIHFANNEQDEFKFITLPDNWWCIQYSYPLDTPKEPAQIIPISKKEASKALPAVNYWHIKQGDYRVREQQRQILDRQKFRKIIEKSSLSAAVIVSSLIVILFSYLISRIG